MRKCVINKVAVLGAGVMGSQIAAHFANCNFTVLLYDLPGRAAQAIQGLTKLKPSPLAVTTGHKLTVSNIMPLDYENNSLELLMQCDLIIEAVAENIEIKINLYEKIKIFINHNALFCTNTSGLSINKLATALKAVKNNKNLSSRFCGVHFFNPPRYQKLVELIGHDETSPDVLDGLEEFFTRYLGKGVVRANDTPNFIANRIGVFSLLTVMYYAKKYDISLDLADVLTGELIGRAKSATFRTADVVGLDTLDLVIRTMGEQCLDDPWKEYLKSPEYLSHLIAKKSFGQKSGRGFYKKSGSIIEVYNINTDSYSKSNLSLENVDKKLLSILQNKDINIKYNDLKNYNHPQAQFLWESFRELWIYTAYHLTDISGSVRDVDKALRWGFGWQHGPFELWQASGWQNINKLISDDINNNKSLVKNITFPNWVSSDLCKNGVYNNSLGLAFNARANTFTEQADLAVYKRQYKYTSMSAKEIILENKDAKLWIYHKNNIDNLIFSFKTKANVITSDLISLLSDAIDYITDHNDKYAYLIIWQDRGDNFCAGADLKGFLGCVETSNYELMDQVLCRFQNLCQKIRYCNFPVIAACKGMVLGGGTELLMHCDRVVAALESYIGLVEVGVGVIPAGGGCKEMLLRANNHYYTNYAEIDKITEQYFKSIATAQVSSSAQDAIRLGYLRVNDVIIANTDELLNTAISTANHIVYGNYQSPTKNKLKVSSNRLKANILALLANYFAGNFITQHDYTIASKLADVLSGGNVDVESEVSEEWLLQLERRAFVELLQLVPTQERINHMLSTGKPLRN